uniref:Uncharacterized protein n=1 Tax=Globodera pallida TaxID=36090 RepID=A0A183C562_GLOPA
MDAEGGGAKGRLREIYRLGSERGEGQLSATNLPYGISRERAGRGKRGRERECSPRPFAHVPHCQQQLAGRQRLTAWPIVAAAKRWSSGRADAEKCAAERKAERAAVGSGRNCSNSPPNTRSRKVQPPLILECRKGVPGSRRIRPPALAANPMAAPPHLCDSGTESDDDELELLDSSKCFDGANK